MSWSATLPSHHRHWLDLAVGGAIVGERRATCHDCAMCSEGLPPSVSPFLPQTKCCTYLPEIANFLVGRALAEPAGPGRRSIVARIEAQQAVTPLGLGKTEAFLENYGARTFGTQEAFRCPHYLADQEGMCGIWQNRNSICATWFCRYDRGLSGKRFWATASRYLKVLEQNLARWCVQAVDPEVPSALAARTGSADEKGPASWGRWLGQEQVFYQACAAKLAELSPAEQLEMAGPEAQLAAALLREAFAERQSPDIPEPLVEGDYAIKSRDSGLTWVEAYSPLDPLELPTPLLEALACFDGQRSNAQAVGAVKEAYGLEISEDRLRELVDFGILRPARTMLQDVADALAALRARVKP